MIIPLMQYPHCTACSSMKSLCSDAKVRWLGMLRPLTLVLAVLAMAAPASAAVQPFPKDFRTQMIEVFSTT
jgi:hypothetical protein